MRALLIGSAFTLLGLTAASAGAMPFPPLADQTPSAYTLTAGGCGAGFHRGPNGGCRPNGGGAYYGHPYAHPHPYAGRHCWWRGGVRVCN